MRKKIKILVADDHNVLRQGLITLLQTVEQYEIIGQASNGHEVLAFLEDYQPDVIILDIEMPLMNGREALIVIKKTYPQIKVIMLTMYNGMLYENEYRTLGADSFLTKNTDFEHITNTINTAYFGKYSFNSDSQKNKAIELCPNHLQLALNIKEIQILKLICNNKSNNFISGNLHVSENTVRYHRKNIYSKTKTSSITELIKYAIKNGIISLD